VSPQKVTDWTVLGQSFKNNQLGVRLDYIYFLERKFGGLMKHQDEILCRALMRSLAFTQCVDDFLQILVTSVLAAHRPSAACFMRLRGGAFEPFGHFGLSKQEITEISQGDAKDPFRASIVESKSLVFRSRGEFLGNAQNSFEAGSSIPGPSLILPFETMTALQGVLWVKFHDPLASRQLSQIDLRFLQLSGELIIAKSTHSSKEIDDRNSTLDLSELEARIATLAERGLTNRQIAKSMFISESWVKKNLQSAYLKLGISSRLDLRSRLTHLNLDSKDA
jgi:DNA-binding CsgD family transcriptional regulator